MNNTLKKRPSWEEYFIRLAHVVKDRSDCIRMNVGVVIVKDKRIIATGYNGAPMGIPNCSEGGCKRCEDRAKNKLKEGERKDLCICLHAEQNALLQSAFHGVSTRGATVYSTVSPCLQCAKAIINSGVTAVVYEGDHSDKLGIDLLSAVGVNVSQHK